MSDLVEVGKFLGSLPASTAFTVLILFGMLAYITLRDQLRAKHDALAGDLRPQVIAARTGTESNTVRVGDLEKRVTGLEFERGTIVTEMRNGHALIMSELAELKRDLEANTSVTADLDKKVAVQQEWITDQKYGGRRGG